MKDRRVRNFKISPAIPEKLLPLVQVAKDFWWCWHQEAIELLQSLDIELWHKYRHSPYKVILELSQNRLQELATDEDFLSKLQSVVEIREEYLTRKSWYDKNYGDSKSIIAYFSAEFGIHESLPNYSGGLGVLAGDHLKSASDVGLPLYGIGLFYQHGYFSQYLNEDGWQQEDYPLVDPFYLPLDAVTENGKPMLIDIDFPGRKVFARIWQVNVGRVKLYLLDTNVSENGPSDRQITDKLYGGDTEHRIQQEIVLGVGGIRALKKMGIHPTVVHMNEGHSAFSAFERIRAHIFEDNLSYLEARELVKTSTVFTTHTPVPAGNESFPDSMMSVYLEPYITAFGIPLDEFLRIGRIHPDQATENFGMTVFSLNISAYANGVSKLHGRVSREMWYEIWQNIKPEEAPIGHITNGIHLPSWISDEMERLYRRFLGPDWKLKADSASTWSKVDNIPDTELWRAKERLKERLVAYVRRITKETLTAHKTSPQKIADADNLLDPEALTIGFSRRFATYKRATLLFKDVERLKKILTNKKRPVQFIFAGKSHPRDMEGKKLIKEIVHFAADTGLQNQIVFLENYDIFMARYLVQGVDVWLNNPRRPHEASGTSGMKVPANGGLNLSILDGWWAEAYHPRLGWAIGSGEEYKDDEYQDYVESRALYNILEREVVPIYYEKGADGISRNWIKMMKQSIQYNSPQFHTDRMVKQYFAKMYSAPTENYRNMAANKFALTRKYSNWYQKVNAVWSGIQIEKVEVTDDAPGFEFKVGDTVYVTASLKLNGLQPEDIEVCAVYSQSVNLDAPETSVLSFLKMDGDLAIYRAEIEPQSPGAYSASVRITPRHENRLRKLEAGLIKWY